MTNAGGLGILCADACEAAGSSLPELARRDARGARAACCRARRASAIPVDLLGSATAETYAAALPLAPRRPARRRADRPLRPARRRRRRGGRGRDPARRSQRAATGQAGARRRHERRGNAGGACASGLAGRRVPVSRVRRARARARGRARGVAAPAGRDGARARRRRRAPRAADRRRGARGFGRRLARAADRRARCSRRTAIPLVAERVAADVDEARRGRARARLPGRREDRRRGRAQDARRGGVALGLRDEDARARRRRRGSAPPVLVQPMLSAAASSCSPASCRIPCSARSSPSGPGGVLAELIGDAGFRIAPLTDVDAEELVLDGKAGRLVRGFRGAPPADAAALVDLVHRLCASPTTCRRSPSSTSTGPRARTAASRSTPACASPPRRTRGP